MACVEGLPAAAILAGGLPAYAPDATMRRTSSYSLRFSGSDSTSFAAETSLNFSSASLFPGFASGWYCFASLRYARAISFSLAPCGTPSTS